MGPEAAAAASTVPTIKTISEMRWSGGALSPRVAVAGEVTPVNICLGVLTAADFIAQSRVSASRSSPSPASALLIRLSGHFARPFQQQAHDTKDDPGNNRHGRPDHPIPRSGSVQPRQKHQRKPEVAARHQRTCQRGGLAEHQEGNGPLGFHAFMAHLDPLMSRIGQDTDERSNQDQTNGGGPGHLGRDQVKGVGGHHQEPAGQAAEQGGNDERAERCQLERAAGGLLSQAR